MSNYLIHYGVGHDKGGHSGRYPWGSGDKYQNADGTLTEAGRRRLDRKDSRWAKRNYDKIYSKAKKRSKKELSEYAKEIERDRSLRNSSGGLSSKAINLYNQKMAELMTKSVSNITSPSGRSVQFVAKRGSVGVHLGLADAGFDVSTIKNGIWDSGRIAYQKKEVDRW